MVSGQKAFTIIELLLVLVISSAMLFVVMPFGRELINKNHALAGAEELKAALRFTRAVAVMSGETAIFCGSSNHKSCDGLWQEGQIVITRSGRVMRVLPKIFAGDKLIWRGGSAEEKNAVFFSPTGFAKQQGSFIYCPKNDPGNAIAVILLSTGRVRVDNKDLDGKTIGCNF